MQIISAQYLQPEKNLSNISIFAKKLRSHAGEMCFPILTRGSLAKLGHFLPQMSLVMSSTLVISKIIPGPLRPYRLFSISFIYLVSVARYASFQKLLRIVQKAQNERLFPLWSEQIQYIRSNSITLITIAISIHNPKPCLCTNRAF